MRITWMVRTSRRMQMKLKTSSHNFPLVMIWSTMRTSRELQLLEGLKEFVRQREPERNLVTYKITKKLVLSSQGNYRTKVITHHSPPWIRSTDRHDDRLRNQARPRTSSLHWLAKNIVFIPHTCSLASWSWTHYYLGRGIARTYCYYGDKEQGMHQL